MKKSWLLFFVVFTSFGGGGGGISVSAQSLEDGHGLSLGVSAGLLTGVGEEIVYRNEDTKDKLSQLLWEFNALLYAGLDARYTWQIADSWGIFAGASGKFGFPATAGVIEDRDWMAQYPDWLTHYSVHDNKTEEALLFDANIGVSFSIREIFQIKPSVAYRFMRFSWTAKGGSLLYPYDTDGDGTKDGEHAYFTSPINVGTYEQTWHIVSPMIGFSGQFNQYFDIELSLALSPLLWFSGEDHHILRDLVITENLTGGLFVEGGLCLSFKPTPRVTFSIQAAYRNISGPRGDGKYDYESEPDLVAKGLSGAGYSAWDAGITAKWNVGE